MSSNLSGSRPPNRTTTSSRKKILNHSVHDRPRSNTSHDDNGGADDEFGGELSLSSPSSSRSDRRSGWSSRREHQLARHKQGTSPTRREEESKRSYAKSKKTTTTTTHVVTKHVPKNVARLPLAVTGGVESEEEIVEVEDAVTSESDTDDKRRQRNRHHRDGNDDDDEKYSSRSKKHQKSSGSSSSRKSRHDASTPRSRQRPPDSPSLSSLMRAIDPDNLDPAADPFGRHHHAGIHEMTTASQPKLVEYTKISRDGTALEYHVSSTKQYGTAHERTLAEMEAIMRANGEFPSPGRPHGASGFPVDPFETRRQHERVTGDELLDNVLGDPIEPQAHVLDGLDDPAHEKYKKDPFIDEQELEYYRPRAVLPSDRQRIQAALKGEPVLEPSEREFASVASSESRTRPTSTRTRSDSLTELDAHAAQLSLDAAQGVDRFMPPRTPPLITPRLEPPTTPTSHVKSNSPPRTPTELNSVAASNEPQRGGPRPTRDLFDVSPRGLDGGISGELTKKNRSRVLVPELKVSATVALEDDLTQLDRLALNGLPTPATNSIAAGGGGAVSNGVSRAPNGDIFGSVSHGTSNAHFDVHHALSSHATGGGVTNATSQCGLCSDRVAVMYCYDCGLSLCAGSVVRESQFGVATRIGVLENGGSRVDRGCHEAVHQEFHGHHFLRMTELARNEAKKKKDADAMRRVAKVNERERRDKAYEPDLVLVEPPDPLELQPPPPPSPPRFLAMVNDHLKLSDELDTEGERDLAALRGVCALCQGARATVWCEECQLCLCSGSKAVALDGGENVVYQRDDSNPDCDGTLHVGAHATHHRVAYNPEFHKRKLLFRPYDMAVQRARDRGYRPGDAFSPPPSLPPSNVPSPRYVPTKRDLKQLTNVTHVPGEWNYKTGSRNPTCDICAEQEAQVYCQECAMYLCLANGCDHDAHAFANSVESSVHGRHLTSHHRISIKEQIGKLLITPLQTPRFTPENSPRQDEEATRRSARRARSRSRSRSRSPTSSRRTPRRTPRHTSMRWKKNPWCTRCGVNPSKVSCDCCEMNFCTGHGSKNKENCDKVWHESESSFMRHIRVPIDPSSLDHTIEPPTSVRPLTDAEKESMRLIELESRVAAERVASARADQEAIERERETRELEAKMVQRRMSKSFDNADDDDDDDDDVAAFLRSRRDAARELDELDSGPTPRTIHRNMLGDDGFDPDSIQPPPPCAECDENRADVYCCACKKFYCAHALNYTHFDRAPSRIISNADRNRPPSPPRTPTHHNNCFYHVHCLPGNGDHKKIYLRHYESERERRRLAKYAQREREMEASRAEAARLALEAEESRRALAMQKDVALREAEERRLAKIRAKQARHAEQEAAVQQLWKEQEDAHRQALLRQREEMELERQRWLDRARHQIAELDRQREADEKAEQAEFDALRAAHKKLILQRESMLHDADAKRWLAHRDEIRRKRAIRQENIASQQEWLQRRERADKVWREKVARQIMAESKEARLETLKRSNETLARESRLGATAAGIGVKVKPVLETAVEANTDTKARLVQVSAALRQKRFDLAEIEREKRQEAAEAERAAIEEGIRDKLVRKRQDREDEARQQLRDQSHQHRDRLSDLRHAAEEARDRADEAELVRRKVERAAERAAENVAQVRAELDAERDKLMALRERKRQREQAARLKVTKAIKNLGRVREGDNESDATSSSIGSSRTISSFASLSTDRSKARTRPQRPSDLKRHERSLVKSSSASSSKPSSKSSVISRSSQSSSSSSSSSSSMSRVTARSDGTSLTISSSALSEGSTVSSRTDNSRASSSTGYSGASRSGSSYTNTVDGASSVSDESDRSRISQISYAASEWTAASASVDESRSSVYTDRTVSTVPFREQEDFAVDGGTAYDEDDDPDAISMDTFLDTQRSLPSVSSQTTDVPPHGTRHRSERRRSRSRSRSRNARSRSRSPSHRSDGDYFSDDSDSDQTADDLSVTNSMRERRAHLKKAPKARDILREGAGAGLDHNKLTLDTLQERDLRGRLISRGEGDNDQSQHHAHVHARRHVPSSSSHPHLSPDARVPGDPLPSDPSSRSERARRAAIARQADPMEVWAMRVGASERASDTDTIVSDDASAITFHSNYSDVSNSTHASDGISQVSGVDVRDDRSHEFGSSHERRRRRDRDSKHVADASAGLLRNTSHERRAMRHATQAAEATNQRMGQPEHIAEQLLNLLDAAPNVSQPLRTVFNMLVKKWLHESTKQERDTEILHRAFGVLMNKLMASGSRGGVNAQELTQLWQQLMRASLPHLYPSNESDADFSLGHRRGYVEPPFGVSGDGSASSRLDGSTNLLQRADGAAVPSRRPYERDDDIHSVMGGTRSVTGSAFERDEGKDTRQQPMTLAQQRALANGRRMETAESQRRAVQRQAERVIKESPYSDYEQSFESVTTDSQASHDLNDSSRHPFPVHTVGCSDANSEISTSHRPSHGDTSSLASFELGLDPRQRVMEDRRARRMARQGDEPLSEVGSIRSEASTQRAKGEDEASSSSSSSSESDLDSDLSSMVPNRRSSSSSSALTRGKISLPPVTSPAYNEDAWYVDFHRQSLKKDERAARQSQAKYDAMRRRTIEEVRARDLPEPDPNVVQFDDEGRPIRHPAAALVAPGTSSKSALTTASSTAAPVRHPLTVSFATNVQYDEYQPGAATMPIPDNKRESKADLAKMVRTLGQSRQGHIAMKLHLLLFVARFLLIFSISMSHFLCSTADGEVGGLQAAAGWSAQVEPSKFLPHEIRQHQLRFGGNGTNADGTFNPLLSPPKPSSSPSSSYAHLHTAGAFDAKLRQQMYATAEWNQAHGISTLTSSASSPLLHTFPHGDQPPVPHPTSIRSSSKVKMNPRVGAALMKAHESLGLEYPPSKQGHANPSNTHTLPAASNIAPELAYLQQLRRREIIEGKSQSSNTTKRSTGVNRK